jgi:hypothetical protein
MDLNQVTSTEPVATTATPTTLPIGSESRWLRFLIAGFIVVGWCVVGVLLHLSLPLYLLLGVPLLVLFQLGIQRQPLRTLWVRTGPPVRLDGWFVALWLLFSIFPGYAAVREAVLGHLASAAEFSTAIVGAFGLAYALRSMRGANWRQLGLCIVIVGVIGLFPQFVSLVLPHLVHLHTAHPVTTAPLSLGQRLQIVGEWLLISPVGFVVEEVFFRGGLDTYLHRGEKGIGWLSAVYVSLLWGMWHLPGQSITPQNLGTTLIGILVPQLLVGVPLSLFWRASGNLVVSNTAHALLESVRNALAGASLL